MVVKNFAAQVRGGQLQFQESLFELEGQQVQVTVVAAGTAAVDEPSKDVDESAEPPEWLNVEKDIYVKMPFKRTPLENIEVVDGGPMRPTIVLPEIATDE